MFEWLLSSLLLLLCFGIMKSWNEYSIFEQKKELVCCSKSAGNSFCVLKCQTHTVQIFASLQTGLGIVSVWLLKAAEEIAVFHLAVHLLCSQRRKRGLGVSTTPSCHSAGTELKPQLQPSCSRFSLLASCHSCHSGLKMSSDILRAEIRRGVLTF